ncbi:MAG: response regulator [Flaviaesturariibacter sp.]|nr:response regulator [Flaviaesturariibacter sp.]
MSKWGPIIIAEDDIDDRDVLREILTSLEVRNEIRFFDNGQQVLDYLLTTKENPFIILSDVNLPLMSGTRLREEINKNPGLRRKSIPFIFVTTNVEDEAVAKAYNLMVQGYFQKEDNVQQIRETLRLILDYWRICRHPNNG